MYVHVFASAELLYYKSSAEAKTWTYTEDLFHNNIEPLEKGPDFEALSMTPLRFLPIFLPKLNFLTQILQAQKAAHIYV